MSRRGYHRPTPTPTMRTSDQEWRLAAACRGHHTPDLWFPESPARAAAQPAQQICSTCPVTQPCLDHATRHREPYGIWGGLRQIERPGGVGSTQRNRHR